MRITITTNEYEDSLLKELEGKRGWRRQDALRLGLRKLHAEEFPPPPTEKRGRPAKDKSEPTPEERCEEMGGVLVKEKGQNYCVIREGNIERKILL